MGGRVLRVNRLRRGVSNGVVGHVNGPVNTCFKCGTVNVCHARTSLRHAGSGNRIVGRGNITPGLNSVVCTSLSSGNGVAPRSHSVVNGPFPGCSCDFGLNTS